MPQNCAAYGCTARRSLQTRKKGITFHKFPIDPLLKIQWEAAVRRQDFIANSTTVLCSQHFKESDFDRTGQTVRIREGAVPSVFSFPAHLQKKADRQGRKKASQEAAAPIQKKAVTTRQTKVSQQAAAPIQVNVEPEPKKLPVEPELYTAQEHLYAAPHSFERMKDKLAQAHARIENLERQLRNAKDRERRIKRTLKRVLDDLKEKNLITGQLNPRLQNDSDTDIGEGDHNDSHDYISQGDADSGRQAKNQ